MKLSDFTRGWIVGDFFPCLVDTKDVEIGVIDLKAGDKGDSHFHLQHIEFNLILSGEAIIDKRVYGQDEFFIYLPGEKSTVEFTKDTRLLVVKTPATKGDKHYGED